MAFYSNALNFPNLDVKATPTGADQIMIADAAAADKPKQALLSTLPFAPSSGAAVVNVTTATQALAKNTTYFVNYAGGACTLTLPAAATLAQGDFIRIRAGESATDPFVIAQNANQYIRVNSEVTTTGVGGTLTADEIFCNIDLECSSSAGGLAITAVATMGSFSGV